MKKVIHQTLALAVLATSLTSVGTTTAFAKDLKNVQSVKESNVSDIRDIMADYTAKIERGEGQRKSLVEATKLLKEKNISAQELVEFAASGMEASEAASYRAKMKSQMSRIQKGQADNDEMGEMLAEIATGSRGVNFSSSCSAIITTAWVTGISAAIFAIVAINTKNDRDDKESNVKGLKLDKVAIQGEIDILVSEGLPESSFYVANMQADIAYIDEQIAQNQADADKASEDLPTYTAIAGVAGAVSLVTSVIATGKCY